MTAKDEILAVQELNRRVKDSIRKVQDLIPRGKDPIHLKPETWNQKQILKSEEIP